MKIEENKKYYNEDSLHSYMDSEGYDTLVYDFVKKMNLSGLCVLEIGSGFGRYTSLLSKNCGKVIATDPNPFMYENLKKLEEKYQNLFVIEADIEKIKSMTNINPDYIFLFHVLHHLNPKEVLVLLDLMKTMPAKYFFLEPNHLNPLFFFQVLFTKNMRFKEEKGMFRDNSEKLLKTIPHKALLFRNYIGLLPRGMTNKLSKSFPFFSNSNRFICKFKNPFSAYSVLVIDSKIF